MKGANIFIYANAAGTNVTLSPRMGAEEIAPKQGSTADVKLLSRSGISNGMMTANVKCTYLSELSLFYECLLTDIQAPIAIAGVEDR